MKKLIGLAFVAMIVSFAACAQKNVPSKAEQAFMQKFPDAKNVSWGQEGNDVWEAEFKMNGKEMSANYDASGNWKETEMEIDQNQVPAAVSSAFSKNYPEAKVKKIYSVQTMEGTSYEYEMKMDGETMEVVIDANGMVHKAKSEDEESGSESDSEDED